MSDKAYQLRDTVDYIFILSPLGRGTRYCDQRVCLSVCPLANLKNHTSKFQQIFRLVTCGFCSVFF